MSYLLIAEITAMICSGVIPFSNSMACSSLLVVGSSVPFDEDCFFANTLRSVSSVFDVSKLPM